MAATLDIYGVGVTMAGGVVITVVEPIPLIAAFNAYALVAYMIGSLAVAIMVLKKFRNFVVSTEAEFDV